MNPLTGVAALGLAVVLLTWRRTPVAGWRRMAALACRVSALALLALAGSGWVHRRVEERPLQVVYLIDRSASVDDRQQAWIERRIASLEALRPAPVRRAVVAFGADAAVAVPFGRGRLDASDIRSALGRQTVQPERTNLAHGLVAALRLFDGGSGHVVLFSDGRPTAGRAEPVLELLAARDVPVFTVPVPSSDERATRWESLHAPPVVQRGSTVPLDLVLHNAGERTQRAEVAVRMGGIDIRRVPVRLQPGWQVVRVSAPALQQGSLQLDVQVRLPGQTTPESRQVFVEIEGPPHALIIDEEPGRLSFVAAAMKRRGMDISLGRPDELPAGPAELAAYDAVVLLTVPKSSISDAQASALRGYVEDAGGGLMMIGLGGNLSEEIVRPSGLDPLLPVVFEAKGLQEASRRICVIMLIDRSQSMWGRRISATKQAAVELVRQLAPEDLVGVLAFDTEPYVVAEVRPAAETAGRLVDQLVQLKAIGGTNIYPALLAAKERFDQVPADIKHILLLSDGESESFDAEQHRVLLNELIRDHVSISAIGIAASGGEPYLQWLARETGGNYYAMRTLDELPKLVVQDTRDMVGRLPFAEGAFPTKRHPQAAWFNHADESWPVLQGFLTASAKPGATVEGIIEAGEEQHPLLAHWTAGRGRVAAFTSDAGARWSPAWVQWAGFESWWATVMRSLMRQRLTDDVFVWPEGAGAGRRVVIEGRLSDPAVRLTDSRGAAWPISVHQAGRFSWQAGAAHVPDGWYRLEIESATEQGTAHTAQWIRIGGAAADDEERPNQPADDAALRQVALATSGAHDVPDRALVPPTRRVSVEAPIAAWWLPWVLLLVLIDIAVRGSTMLTRGRVPQPVP